MKENHNVPRTFTENNAIRKDHSEITCVLRERERGGEREREREGERDRDTERGRERGRESERVREKERKLGGVNRDGEVTMESTQQNAWL